MTIQSNSQRLGMAIMITLMSLSALASCIITVFCRPLLGGFGLAVHLVVVALVCCNWLVEQHIDELRPIEAILVFE